MKILCPALLALPLLFVSSVPAVSAQGVSATAQSTTAGTVEELKRLRATVEDLTQRVKELEKQRLDFLKDKAAEAAEQTANETRTARLEQRLGSLEKARQGESAQRAPAQRAESEQPLTVVAPFVVKDRAGKTILVVQEEGTSTAPAPAVPVPGGSRGLYVYGAKPGAALAHLGVARGGEAGRVYIARADAPRPDIILAYDNGGPILVLNNAANGQVASLDKSGFTFFNPAGYPVGEIRSKDGRGLLLLNSPDGSHMVEAGSLASGKGYVMATPWKTSTDLAGDPSVIMGGKKP